MQKLKSNDHPQHRDDRKLEEQVFIAGFSLTKFFSTLSRYGENKSVCNKAVRRTLLLGSDIGPNFFLENFTRTAVKAQFNSDHYDRIQLFPYSMIFRSRRGLVGSVLSY